jgi:hypothetical protein
VVSAHWRSGANCIAAYQPKGAADLAASYVNVANPGTYNAAPGVAPTFDTATGWTFNGSTQYLDTGIVPVNNQAWSGFVRFSDRGGITVMPFGRVEACRFAIQLSSISNGVVYQNGSYSSSVSPAPTSGILGMAGVKGYRNGVDEGITIPAAGGSFSGSILIGQSGYGGYEDWMAGKIQTLAIYDVTLTGAQVTQLTASMAAL